MFAVAVRRGVEQAGLEAPGRLPAEPALFGVSLTPRRPAGYDFDLVVPGRVGPVVEKGMVPLFGGMRGQAEP